MSKFVILPKKKDTGSRRYGTASEGQCMQFHEGSSAAGTGTHEKRRRDPCIWLLILSQRDQADHAVGLIDKSVHRNAVSNVDHIISVSVKEEKRWIKRKYKRA